MTDKQIKEKVKNMSIEDKVLLLTQYPSYLPGDTEVVTGGSVYGLTVDELRKTGSTLNTSCGEETARLRRDKAENGNGEPFAIMHDVIHGYRTIYPVPLALACSFDTNIIEQCAKMAALEAKSDGVDVTFSPMVDLARDARWGRVMESAGEDQLLGGEVGKAFIRGYHEGGLACCIKHYAAYGAAEAGKEYNTTEVSEHTLREYYLKGYQACMDEKPELFMSSFNALNGKPTLAHRKLMVDILRDEWGFDGVLISDYSSVYEMITHGYCKDKKEAALVAIKAKLDVEMSSTCYKEYLPELIADGKVSETELDEAVERFIRLTDKIGLYENPMGSMNFEKRDKIVLSKEHREIARKAAQESCVLLKNNGVLPLEKSVNAVYVGPFADEKGIIGTWACHGKNDEAVSIKDGIEALIGRKIKTAKGVSHSLDEANLDGIDEAVKTACGADVIVACIGEYQDNSGEAHSRSDIKIPWAQRKLVKELHKLGKPIVLVVFGGRPQVLCDIEPYASAILYVWQPGTEGGNAIANLLYGEAVPCGKAAMSFPMSSGQCPIYYNRFSTGRPNEKKAPIYASGYDDIPTVPFYPFGYGLSYTEFEYSDLKLSSAEMKKYGKITASVKVKNVGKRGGVEIVQWYIHDRFASRIRPIKELKGYERIFLKSGEERTVTFDITDDKLAFWTDNNVFESESGSFELFVGTNSRDTLKADFELA